MEQNYTAVFDIDCGVSSGFGIKYPDRVEKREKFSSKNPEQAYQQAMSMAEKFADDYLSNPETGLTTVQLSVLRSPNKEVSFDISKSIVKRSMLEHLLAINNS